MSETIASNKFARDSFIAPITEALNKICKEL